MTRHNSCRVSPFGNPRITARLTAPRGISQPPTSFIGSQCQGIHHAPLNTYNTKNQKMRKNHTTTNHTPPTHPTRANQPAPDHNRPETKRVRLDARNHYPQIKHHTPPPSRATTRTPNNPHPQHRRQTRPGENIRSQHQPPTGPACEPVASGPNSVSGDTEAIKPRTPAKNKFSKCLLRTHPNTHYRRRAHIPTTTRFRHCDGGGGTPTNIGATNGAP